MKLSFSADDGDRLGPPVVVTAAALLAFLGSWLTWGSFRGFASAIDVYPILFCDFHYHYYPMARSILAARAARPGYFYPAFFALAIIPFGLLPEGQAKWLWGGVQIAASLLLCLAPCWRLVRVSRPVLAVYALFFFWSVPLLNNFKWGQVSVFVTLLVVGSFVAYRRSRPILAGALLAVATCVKYYPALFIGYFLCRRAYRVVGAFAIACGVLFVAVPVAVLGPRAWWAFETNVLAQLHQADWIPNAPNSQFFAHVVARWFLDDPHQTIDPLTLAGLTVAGALIALLNLALVRSAIRSALKHELLLSLTLLFCTLPFLVKTSWPHYFVYLPLGQLAAATVLHDLPATRARLALLFPLLLSMALSQGLLLFQFENWLDYIHADPLFWSNALLLLTLYGAVFLGRRRAAHSAAASPSACTPLP